MEFLYNKEFCFYKKKKIIILGPSGENIWVSTTILFGLSANSLKNLTFCNGNLDSKKEFGVVHKSLHYGPYGVNILKCFLSKNLRQKRKCNKKFQFPSSLNHIHTVLIK